MLRSLWKEGKFRDHSKEYYFSTFIIFSDDVINKGARINNFVQQITCFLLLHLATSVYYQRIEKISITFKNKLTILLLL